MVVERRGRHRFHRLADERVAEAIERLAAALLTALVDRAWLVRRPSGRAVAVTPRGVSGLGDTLGLDVTAPAPAAIDRTPLRRVA